ncbi:MAG: pyridoxal phosphate-dependent aminotransferase [Dehalococcoidia bacterium]
MRPRPEVESLKACPHGGIDYGELESLGISPEAIIDFSVSSNPFGPPPGVWDGLKGVALDRYPDSAATELRRCLSARLGVPPESILAGSGSMELIRLVALAYFGPGDRVLIVEPTFGEYEVASHLAGCQVIRQRTEAGDGFRLRLKDALGLIRRHRPKGVFVCNPNSPTGQYLGRGEVEEILAACPEGLLILDEAFIAFVEDAWNSLDMIEGGNLLLLRSMTKDYALAGLRMGYAIAHPQTISALRRVCPPWNTSAVAQRAAMAALRDEKFLAQSLARLREARDFLVVELTRLGLPPLPSRVNFFLVEVDDAARFRLALLKKGILVRDCTSFGLPRHVRIAVRPLPQAQRLIQALGEVTADGRSRG